MTQALLDAIVRDEHPTFALLYRPHANPGRLEVLIGDGYPVARLSALETARETLVLIPYRQIVERGQACHDDGTPMIALDVAKRGTLSLADARKSLPEDTIALSGQTFDLDDDEYAAIVRQVVAEEIGRGEGANFVIRRSLLASIGDYSIRAALALFRRLLAGELGAYWTFVVRAGGRTLVGATPERHLTLAGGSATMNPISGTYGYPPGGPTVPGLLRFLADRKEAEELYMVVDEELKMLSRFCASGAQVRGPRLREMARLAHTEYSVVGRTDADVRDILRATMFAPTVVGSPLASACRVVARHERRGRGYYGGVIALIDKDAMDSAILIRTADIDHAGRLEIGVGASLVRHSDPAGEAAETRAKAAGLLAAVTGRTAPAVPRDPRITRALKRRNEPLARFWLAPPGRRRRPVPELVGKRVLVIDAEDDFTAMLAHQVRALGAAAVVCPWHAFEGSASLAGTAHAVIVGPGPGDPRASHDPKIAKLVEITERLLLDRTPFLSVCLGHQVLARVLGLELRRKDQPAQGLQREIDFFGRRERVGSYHTFAAYCFCDTFNGFEISRDSDTGEVHGLRRPGVRSIQFHLESVLTPYGPRILADLLTSVLVG